MDKNCIFFKTRWQLDPMSSKRSKTMCYKGVNSLYLFSLTLNSIKSMLFYLQQVCHSKLVEKTVFGYYLSFFCDYMNTGKLWNAGDKSIMHRKMLFWYDDWNVYVYTQDKTTRSDWPQIYAEQRLLTCTGTLTVVSCSQIHQPTFFFHV